MLVFIGHYLPNSTCNLAKMCTLLDHLVRYGSNQSLCVASRGLRYNLDQNKPMYTYVHPHCNFKQLWRNKKRSHNPHLYSKYMISLAGNSKGIENLLTCDWYFWRIVFYRARTIITAYLDRGATLNRGTYPAQTGVVPDLVTDWNIPSALAIGILLSYRKPSMLFCRNFSGY